MIHSQEILARCRAAERDGYQRYPLTRELVLDGDTPVSAFAKLHRGEYGFLFESLEGGERWARYTILGTEPRAVFRYRGSAVHQVGADGSDTRVVGDAAPLDHLSDLMRETRAAPVAGLPRFTGGAVGFWGYDVVRSIEHLPSAPEDDRNLPDAVAMLVDTLLVLDHLFHRAIVIANVDLTGSPSDDELLNRIATAYATADEWLLRLRAPATLAPLSHPEQLPVLDRGSRFADEDFRHAVRTIQDYISAGDAFQVVLSRRIDVDDECDPYLTYRWLRAQNPAPYCYFVRVGELTLVGASPEVLVRVEDRVVTVRPIAGTRPRGADAESDLANERELLADPKERAEHTMLVDLGRNDVGRVSEWGSVEVAAHMVVERYSQVMHLVSEVRGKLREGLDALDALAAAFPAGTVSGAPKVRAMEIIDELEPTRRGPYAGAVGYVGYGAETLDTAIAIRTVVFIGGKASVQAGAGVVADSVPELEFRETEAKAAAVLRALALARRR